MKIETTLPYKLVISFHGQGEPFTGIMAVSAFLEMASPGRWGYLSEGLSSEIFQFTAYELEESAIERFQSWLDEVILNGINNWRQQL